MASESKKRVLVLCTGNSCRSQMAEGWVNHLLGGQWEARSSGTAPASRVHPLAIRAMAESGVDISAGTPEHVSVYFDQRWDLVLTVCDSAQETCPAFPRPVPKLMDAFGGLWKVMPVYAVLTLIVALSSMGLPGLNGFIGEFIILLGAFGSQVLGSPWFAGLAAVGVILAAVYILYMFQKMFLGPVDKEENRTLLDLNWREIVTLVPLLIFIFWIGLYPAPFFNLMGPAVEKVVVALQGAAVAGLP